MVWECKCNERTKCLNVYYEWHAIHLNTHTQALWETQCGSNYCCYLQTKWKMSGGKFLMKKKKERSYNRLQEEQNTCLAGKWWALNRIAANSEDEKENESFI